MTNEQTKQALQVIKQTLDEALRKGVAANLEQAHLITQAFQIINQALNNGQQPSTDSN
jgi:hypothetical protein